MLVKKSVTIDETAGTFSVGKVEEVIMLACSGREQAGWLRRKELLEVLCHLPCVSRCNIGLINIL